MCDKDPWVYLTYNPVDTTDYDYNSDVIANVIGAQWPNKNHFMGIMIPGAPTGQDYFIWETIIHFEVIGQTVRNKTPTPSDPVGLSTVLNSLSPETQKQNNSGEKVMEAVKQGTKNMSFATMVETVVPIVKEVAQIAAIVT